jgi:hypothetical protein
MISEFNYDETKVPVYQLPDPLVGSNGMPVENEAAWWNVRRSEILRLFEQEMYGKTPGKYEGMRIAWHPTVGNALGDAAVRKQMTVYFTPLLGGPKMDLLIYQPTQGSGPFPLFLSMNFQGNHSIHPDPGIRLSDGWFPEGARGIVDQHATDASRGLASSRWPVEVILRRGYALATVYYGDLDPDFDDDFQNGIHPLFPRTGSDD